VNIPGTQTTLSIGHKTGGEEMGRKEGERKGGEKSVFNGDEGLRGMSRGTR